MAVKIRMKRTGAKNDACFRVVAADVRSPRDGKNLEILGWYNPGAKGQTFALKLDRVDYWLGNGAQISDTVASLVKKARKAPVGETVADLPAAAPAEAVAEESAAPVETVAAVPAAAETAPEPETVEAAADKVAPETDAN